MVHNRLTEPVFTAYFEEICSGTEDDLDWLNDFSIDDELWVNIFQRIVAQIIKRLVAEEEAAERGA
ncbi:MAG: hypothetical protein JXA14_07735 [Anaerolineae bacterium]|nr:hypothetical protein [Anaerolineae bacterium]